MHVHQLKDIMSRQIRRVAPDTPILEALRSMRRENISCLLVFMNDEPIGILTERDLIRSIDKILARRKLVVRDLMSQSLLTIEQSKTPGDALVIMRENKIRHLAVVDADFNIVGMLSLTDLLKKVNDRCFFAIGTIDEIMVRDVHTVELGNSARRALREMADLEYSCIVVTENRLPLGILTERDLVWLLTEHPELWSTQIEDIMSMPVTTLAAGATPRAAIDLMNREGLRHLVIINPTGEICGLLTQSILCRELNCPVSN